MKRRSNRSSRQSAAKSFSPTPKPWTNLSILAQSRVQELVQKLWDAVERTVENVARSDKQSRRFLPKSDLAQTLNYEPLRLLFSELVSEIPISGGTDEVVTAWIRATLGRGGPSRIALLALFLCGNSEELLLLYLGWLKATTDQIRPYHDPPIPSDESIPFTVPTLIRYKVPVKYHEYILENQSIFKPVTIRQLTHHKIKTIERLPFIGRLEPVKRGSSGDVVKAEIAKCHWETEEHHLWSHGNRINSKIIALKNFKAMEKGQYLEKATRDFDIELNILKILQDSNIQHDMILLALGSITVLDEMEMPVCHSLIFDLADFSLNDLLNDWNLARENSGQSSLLESLVGIVGASSFLHEEHNILHLDIRPENILVFKKGTGSRKKNRYNLIWKLSNFSLARTKLPKQENTRESDVPVVTSPNLYQAPEVREQGIGKADQGSDVWSVGCVALMVLALMIRGPMEVKHLEMLDLLVYSKDRRTEPSIYETSDSYHWEERNSYEPLCLPSMPLDEDYIFDTARQLRASLNSKLIAWSNRLLLKSCAQQVQQQFVLETLKVLLGGVLRIDRDKRITASALRDRLAEIQENWALYERAPSSFPYRDISTALCLQETNETQEDGDNSHGNNNRIQVQLFSAIERDDAASVRLLLEQNPEALNQLHPGMNRYPIHWALRLNAYNSLEALLEKAAPEIINIICNGRTALEIACAVGDVEALNCIRKYHEKFIFPREVYEKHRRTMTLSVREVSDDLFGIKRDETPGESILYFSGDEGIATPSELRPVTKDLRHDGTPYAPKAATSRSNTKTESDRVLELENTRQAQQILQNSAPDLDFLDSRLRGFDSEETITHGKENDIAKPKEPAPILSDEAKRFTVESEANSQQRATFPYSVVPQDKIENIMSHPTDMNMNAIKAPYRIHWSCSCGHEDFDDFREIIPGAIDKLVNLLKANGVRSYAEVRSSESRTFQLYRLYLLVRNVFLHHSRTAKEFFHNVSQPNTSHPSASGSAGIPGLSILSSTASSGQQTTQSTNTLHSIGSQNSPSGSAHNAVAQGQQPLKSSQNDYMLLCADEQGWLTTWEDLDVSPIRSDRELFDSFHKRIKRRKRWVHQFVSLKTIQRIFFVKFALRQNQEVDQLQHDKIPPPTETHYDFHERVPGHVPPIGNRFFMHRFSNSAHCRDSTYCLSQIPKRVRGRPQYGSAPDNFTAWGLYFHEDFDMVRLWLCGIVMFLISLIFGVAWAANKKSIQDGFTVASYILALEALTIGTVQVGIGLDWI